MITLNVPNCLIFTTGLPFAVNICGRSLVSFSTCSVLSRSIAYKYSSTFLDLASHSRILLYNRPKHKLLYRWLGLYPLYILSEVAIIATDLAELLGSAIALCLLFPKLELWHGVLITAFDVILILGMGDPLRGRPMRFFEILIAAMVCSLSCKNVFLIS